MRIKNSFLNVSSNFVIILLKIVLAFIVRTIFIVKLGQEYLGLDGLFINILNVISLTELGIGTAINYILYEPLSKNDYEKVSLIMSFFKRVYFIIGLTVFGIGLIIMFFIPSIAHDISIQDNLYLLFFLYLVNTVFIYFISYKDTLILADQKNYKLTGIYLAINVLTSILQIIVLVVYESFILYILVQIILNFIQRVLINKYIGKLYEKVSFNEKKKLPKQFKKKIVENVKAVFLHKAGFYLVNSTDNIIISKFLNLALVGIYTNYLSLINMATTALTSLFTAITASFGNLVVLEGKKAQENTFDVLNFTSKVLYGFVTLGFALFINEFIYLWVGKGYVLELNVVLLMCFNFYIFGMISPIDVVRQASGIYTKDKYVSLIQAVVNLLVSIILVQKIGLIGVIIGTTVSTLLLPVIVKPYIIYKYVFDSKPNLYYVNYVLNSIVLVLLYLAFYQLFSNMSSITWGYLFVKLIIFSILYFTIQFILNIKNKNLIFYIQLAKNKFRRKKYE